ncbi:hypothetical protein VINI7043_14410 [Vibrio nigripulchritudo ATCC 27043]|nr:hypothetical protein VINI7043_14410 [Vibrio nigripulchritudo ATCC 27043]
MRILELLMLAWLTFLTLYQFNQAFKGVVDVWLLTL